MPVEKHDFVRVDYVGRLNSQVFDTSIADIAKKEGAFNPQRRYTPLVISVGDGDVVKGFDEALMGMKEGETKSVTIPPEKGYGKRDPKLIKIVPINVFKKNEINPVPGMIVTLDNLPARVQSVSGGRVRVDFNHELAGKTLDFDITIKGIVKEENEKIKALANEFFIDGDVTIGIKDKQVTITPKPSVLTSKEYARAKAYFINEMGRRFKSHKVEFVEKYDNPQKTA